MLKLSKVKKYRFLTIISFIFYFLIFSVFLAWFILNKNIIFKPAYLHSFDVIYNNLKGFVNNLNLLFISSKSSLIFEKNDEFFFIKIYKNKICFNPIYSYIICQYNGYVIYPTQNSFPFKRYMFNINISDRCISFFDENICFSWNLNYVRINISNKTYTFSNSMCIGDICISIINKSYNTLKGFVYKVDEINFGIFGEDTPFFLIFSCEKNYPRFCIYTRDMFLPENSKIIKVLFEPENQNIIYDKGYIYIYKEVCDDVITFHIRFLRK